MSLVRARPEANYSIFFFFFHGLRCAIFFIIYHLTFLIHYLFIIFICQTKFVTIICFFSLMPCSLLLINYYRLRFQKWNLSFQNQPIRRRIFWLKVVIKSVLVILFWRWGCFCPLISVYVFCSNEHGFYLWFIFSRIGF